MYKYWAVVRQMVIKTLAFRSEILIWIFLDTLPIVVLFLVWVQLFSQQSEIRGMTLTQTIQYYVLVSLVAGVISCHFEEWRSREVKEGKIDYFMIRPLSYVNEVLLKDLGGKLTYLGIFLPLYTLFYVTSTILFDIPSLTISLSQLLTILGLLAIGYSISFMIALWIVLGTFWLEGSDGLQHFKWVVISIFSGSMIPVAFMPNWLQNVVSVLPFKYLFDIPIRMIQQTYQLTFSDLIYIAVIMVIMIVVTALLWSKAVYQYASAGG